MSQGAVLLVGCAAASVGVLSTFFSSRDFEVASANDSSEAFLLSMTQTFNYIVVDLTQNEAENALVVESITLVNPATKIAAITNGDAHLSSDSTKLALSKTRRILRKPESDPDGLEALLTA